MLSAAAGGRVKVWVRSTWQEPVNLYVAPALESGNRKSGVVREVTAPIREWERRQEKDRRPDVAAARSQRRVAEQALEHAEARAAKESIRDSGRRCSPKRSSWRAGWRRSRPSTPRGCSRRTALRSAWPA